MKRRKRDPTPDEIAAACLAIQVTWSDDDFAERRVVRPKNRPVDPRVEKLATTAMEFKLEERRSR